MSVIEHREMSASKCNPRQSIGIAVFFIDDWQRSESSSKGSRWTMLLGKRF